MSQLEQLTASPIETVYGNSALNESIELGKVTIQCSLGSQNCQGEGAAILQFTPKCKLRFTCPIVDESPMAGLRMALGHDGKTTIQLVDRGMSFEGFVASTRNHEIEFAPTYSVVTATPPTPSIARAIFHLFNFPDFSGPEDYCLVTGSAPHFGYERCGRVLLKADGWTITIAATAFTDTRTKELHAQGGFGITHMGEIKRDDGAAFSSTDLDAVLACLHYFLSFATGRWAGPALPIGFDSLGNRVYEQWGLGITADGDWSSSSSWFDLHHGELLGQVFPGFMQRWSNPLWRQPLAHALYWYLGASGRGVGIGVDTGLILAQTALEGLAWNFCTQDRKMVSAAAFAERGGLNAANKLRLLATALGIPTAIPPTKAALSFRKGKKWEDAMEAITCIRNALVHPDASAPVQSGAYYEALQFSLWFIDLVILRLCGHMGKYANRMDRNFVGVVESVPWA